MPHRRPAPKQKRHEEGLHRHPGPQLHQRITGITKATRSRITTKTSYKDFRAAAYGLPPLVIPDTNEANICDPLLDLYMDPPPMAEGPSSHVEWLDECLPQLAGESSEDDYLCEEMDTDVDASTTDEDEDDGGHMELEE